LLVLTPREFEEAVATLLAGHGYRDVRVNGGPGDLGVDISCRTPAGARVVVQCKRYAPGKSVGSPDMQRFLGMVVHHGADCGGIYVTTSSFTTAARDLARGYRITLIDGDELSRMMTASSVPPE
jgi:restriction system protein